MSYTLCDVYGWGPCAASPHFKLGAIVGHPNDILCPLGTMDACHLESYPSIREFDVPQTDIVVQNADYMGWAKVGVRFSCPVVRIREFSDPIPPAKPRHYLDSPPTSAGSSGKRPSFDLPRKPAYMLVGLMIVPNLSLSIIQYPETIIHNPLGPNRNYASDMVIALKLQKIDDYLWELEGTGGVKPYLQPARRDYEERLCSNPEQPRENRSAT